MSILGHVLGEVASNVFSTMAGARAAGSSQVEQMAQLARQCGYTVGGQSGGTLTLHVPTPFGVRGVTVICNSQVTGFAVFSAFNQPAHRVNPELLGHLMTRTGKAEIGGWLLTEHDNGNACFGMRYVTHTLGLGAAFLKFALDALVEEVNDFDSRLQQANLL